MNAIANGTAHALANGTAHAVSAKSDHAKISEVKSPDLTSPDLPDLNLPGLGSSSPSPSVPRDGSATDHDDRCCFPPCGQVRDTWSFFCADHAQRWMRAGRVKPRAKKSPRERFEAIGWTENLVVEALGPCWEWKGSRNTDGYGNFTMPGSMSAHKSAYLLENGSIERGLHVLHRCDNPPCVNPKHLYAGTRSDNMQDMWSRGRHPRQRISDQDVADIRSRYTGAWGEQVAIAREYGVSSNQINLIVRGLAHRAAIAKIEATSTATDTTGHHATRMMPRTTR